jgi:ABC-2 type transport system ATP-binding protein
MISVHELRKRYDGNDALDGYSLEVSRGEMFGLVGPNGAGKTTLIRILATLVKPDSGHAGIAGHDVTRDPFAVRAVTGYMPDVPGVYQDLTVEEFLTFFAEAFHLRGARKRAAVERALSWSGMAERRMSYVEQLSLGLKQRLVLARTLLHEPKVLLLDEPATGLDPLARIELREQLKRLNREGVTIFLSSHILNDLEDICSRVAFIERGRNLPGEGSVLTLRSAAKDDVLTCEIEILGEPDGITAALRAFPSARLLETRGNIYRTEISGGSQRAAELLRHLVTSGVAVLRFDPRGPDLEDHYRSLFGGKPS